MLILTPAYNRDFASKKAILEHLSQNKDFIINDRFGAYRQYDGKPVNLSQLKKDKITQVTFRYKKLTKTVIIDVSRLN